MIIYWLFNNQVLPAIKEPQAVRSIQLHNLWCGLGGEIIENKKKYDGVVI